jgi:hypothetical protein
MLRGEELHYHIFFHEMSFLVAPMKENGLHGIYNIYERDERLERHFRDLEVSRKVMMKI